MEREMKEMELTGDKSKAQGGGASLSLQEVEKALDDAGIYKGTNPLAYTSPALKKLGYSSLAEAWISLNPFERWIPYTFSWDSSESNDSDCNYYHPSGSRHHSHLDKFIKAMEKYGVPKDDSTRFYEEVIADFELVEHDQDATTSSKNKGVFEKWSVFFGKHKKDWGTSSLEQFLWNFLQKYTLLLAV